MLQVITELEIRLLHSGLNYVFVSLEALSVIRPLVEALMVYFGSGWCSCGVQRLEEEKLEGRRLGGEART